MNELKKRQFDLIEKVRPQIDQWALKRDVKLANIEIVASLLEDQFDLGVVFFFATDADLVEYREDGRTDEIAAKYIASLRELGYPEEWVPIITFDFDSKENVDKNFEGSYFYRMR